jgi:hypothetical protein
MTPIAQWQEWQDYLIQRVERHGRLQAGARAKSAPAAPGEEAASS